MKVKEQMKFRFKWKKGYQAPPSGSEMHRNGHVIPTSAIASRVNFTFFGTEHSVQIQGSCHRRFKKQSEWQG